MCKEGFVFGMVMELHQTLSQRHREREGEKESTKATKRKVLQIPAKLYTLIRQTLKADVLTNQRHIESTAVQLPSKHIQRVKIICSIFHSNKPEPILDVNKNLNINKQNGKKKRKTDGKRGRKRKSKRMKRH